MDATKATFRRSRWSHLPTLWDGKATWCLMLGCQIVPGKIAARLSFYEPNVRPKKTSVQFLINTKDEEDARGVLREIARARHALEAQVALGLLEEAGVISERHLEEW